MCHHLTRQCLSNSRAARGSNRAYVGRGERKSIDLNSPDFQGIQCDFGVLFISELYGDIIADLIAELTNGCRFKSNLQVGKNLGSSRS
jgi:hypothetical protein